MRISLISNCFGIFVEKFIEEMEKSGVTFSSKSIMKGVKGGRKIFLKKIFDYARLYFSIIINSLTKSCDAFYVHFPPHTAPLVYLIRLFSTKKFILNFHGSDLIIHSKFSKFLHFFTKKLVAGSDLIIVPSDSIKNIVLEKFNVEEQKIFISPSSGIDFDIFNREDTKSFNKRKYAAGFVSRIDKGKGWETFVLAVNELKKRKIADGRTFLMVGSGSEDKKKFQMIQDMGLDDIIDVKGRIERKNLPEFYRELGVFVFPSIREGLGLVGLEAMACGISIIGSKTDGISSYLIDGSNGLFFEPGNFEDLAEKMVRFFNLTQVEKTGFEERAFETASNYEQSRVGVDLYKKIEKTVLPWK